MDENLEVKTRNTSFDSLAATSTTSDFGIDAIRNQQPYSHWPGEPVLTLSPSVPPALQEHFFNSIYNRR
jgi:hypothetical protein